MKIFTVAEVPDELARDWLQWLRDFDTAHAGCHFEVIAEAPAMSLTEIIETLRVNPELSVQHVLQR